MLGFVMAQDFVTATCGLFNTAYFAGYARLREGSRRIAAGVMAAVSAAAVVEALFSQALLWGQQGIDWLGPPPLPVWLLLRMPLLIATVLISLLVLRRMGS